ncbi:hypothetical protein HRG_001138 [Hirsutella rhossiliensis]|uniref:Uncharacterized protein n=1 Tax=Hirsutella rhossiliensis TaxID=111463 RepID=A0A9P8SPS1_9HYPO|nr:uncharacterized protein HRG_01138 [Hirsutella rhossiliensis]KAH0968496.1 hypothetical protein HRG_01138 [Hirsutella rhossiliensis]
MGSLGCKINPDRPLDCDGLWVSLAYGGRQAYLQRLDQSAGAQDIGYDGWNFGMELEHVDASRCSHRLLHPEQGARRPLSAANRIGFLSTCLDRPDSWLATHHALYNTLDPICTLGHDEPCRLDDDAGQQPVCPHVLGEPARLTSTPVYNIRYPTDDRVLAESTDVGAGGGEESGGRSRRFDSMAARA